MTQATKTLILGGARSGKSRLAEQIAGSSGLAVTYIATATVGDEEMHRRIAVHRSQRPADWHTIEEPIHLAAVLSEHAAPDRCLLVDCLTLWLTNLLLASSPECFTNERTALLEVLPRLSGRILLVSNETGMGVMPLGELTRRFCDEVGWLHQEIASICEQVVLTVAGLPLHLKGTL